MPTKACLIYSFLNSSDWPTQHLHFTIFLEQNFIRLVRDKKCLRFLNLSAVICGACWLIIRLLNVSLSATFKLAIYRCPEASSWQLCRSTHFSHVETVRLHAGNIVCATRVHSLTSSPTKGTLEVSPSHPLETTDFSQEWTICYRHQGRVSLTSPSPSRCMHICINYMNGVILCLMFYLICSSLN